MEPAPPPPPATETRYYTSNEGKTLGPFSEAEIRGQIEQRTLSGADLVFREGTEQWIPVAQMFPNLIQDPAAPAPQQVRLWNPNAAALWSVLFSPLFGQILHYKNWRALGDASKSRATLMWIGATAVAFLAAFILPINEVGSLTFLAILIGWYFALGRKQITVVKALYGNSYPRKSLLAAIGIAVLAWVAIYAMIVAVFMVTMPDSAAEPEAISETPQTPAAQAESPAADLARQPEVKALPDTPQSAVEAPEAPDETFEGPSEDEIRGALQKANIPYSGEITHGNAFVADGSGVFPYGAQVYPLKIEGWPFVLYFVQDHFDNWRFLWEEMDSPQLLPVQTN